MCNYSFFILCSEMHVACTENKFFPKLLPPHETLRTSNFRRATFHAYPNFLDLSICAIHKSRVVEILSSVLLWK